MQKELIFEKLLFAAHEGTVGVRTRAAIIMADHCLPIAVSHSREHSEFGFHNLWEATSNVEEFFGILEIENVTPGMNDKEPFVSGLFVYEVSHSSLSQNADEEETSDDFDSDLKRDFGHLEVGDLRRPTVEELLRMANGLAPWEGGVVL